MSACAIHSPDIAPKRKTVSVNGVTIPHQSIAREAQNHRAENPALAFAAAARALVVRELLLQEARRLALTPEPANDASGRRETDEDALIRQLIESLPHERPDEESCRRYYENNVARFRSSDLFEAAHILIAVLPEDEASVTAARKATTELIALLQRDPAGFAAAARIYSACPSRDNGGALGQFSRGQCAPEFEDALDTLSPGEIAPEPTQTSHGFHVLRLDRKVDGARLPFDIVKDRIAGRLAETRRRHVIAGFIAQLGQQARIEGIVFAPDNDADRRGRS